MEVLPIEVMQVPRLKRLDLVGSNRENYSCFLRRSCLKFNKNLNVAPEQLVFPHPSIMASGIRSNIEVPARHFRWHHHHSQIRSSSTFGVIKLAGYVPSRSATGVCCVATAFRQNWTFPENSICGFTGLNESIHLKHFIAARNQLQGIPRDVFDRSKIIGYDRHELQPFDAIPSSCFALPFAQNIVYRRQRVR